MNLVKLSDDEEKLSAFLRDMYPQYRYAVNLIAYWIAIAIESASSPNNAYNQFQENLDMYRQLIKDMKRSNIQ